MAKRLTDRKKKKIIADYLEVESYNAVAKMNGVSKDSVKRVVQACEDFDQKAKEKKEQNTVEILEYIQSKREKVYSIIDRYLDALLDEEKINKATTSQLTTSIGTLIDKINMTSERPEAMAEDPLTKALKEEAERMEENADQ